MVTGILRLMSRTAPLVSPPIGRETVDRGTVPPAPTVAVPVALWTNVAPCFSNTYTCAVITINKMAVPAWGVPLVCPATSPDILAWMREITSPALGLIPSALGRGCMIMSLVSSRLVLITVRALMLMRFIASMPVITPRGTPI